VPKESLTGKWVYDLVYNPSETRLLREAALQGCSTISGAEMFLGQAVKQQQLWCGRQAPAGAMEEELAACLPGRSSDEKRHRAKDREARMTTQE